MQNQLRAIRLQNRLPQLGLASKARVSPATIVQIEKWNHVPRVDVRQRIAATLGVPIEAIWPSTESRMV